MDLSLPIRMIFALVTGALSIWAVVNLLIGWRDGRLPRRRWAGKRVPSDWAYRDKDFFGFANAVALQIGFAALTAYATYSLLH
jgi:hypothetical protein